MVLVWSRSLIKQTFSTAVLRRELRRCQIVQIHFRPQNFAESIHGQIESEFFEFRLLPDDRFTEGEVADVPEPVAHRCDRLSTACNSQTANCPQGFSA